MGIDLSAKRLSLNAAASLLGVHRATIWRWVLTGVRGRKLPTIWIGARRWVLLSDLEAFVSVDATENTEKSGQPEVEAELERLLTATETQLDVLRNHKETGANR